MEGSEPPRTSSPAFTSGLFDARLVLLFGLGGLLLLMTIGGVYTVRTMRGIRARHDAIRSGYLQRNRTLNQIRADLYLSSTYVRDYLLDPEAGTAEDNRTRFEAARSELTRLTNQYSDLLLPEQAKRWKELQNSLDQYWALLAPVWSWDAETRRAQGYAYYRSRVLTRRTHILSIADEIGLMNGQQLTKSDREIDSLFDAVQRRLIWTLVITLVAGGGLALFSMRRILRLEKRAESLFEEAIETRKALQHLSARLVTAQEEERKTIARELHDEVGQSLSALLVGISNIRGMLAAGQFTALDSQLTLVRQMAEESVRTVRNVSLLLRPSMLDDLGLTAALQWQAREVSRNHRLHVSVDAEDVPESLAEDDKLCIYRVVQECLHNAVRHSHATNVDVSLQSNSDALLLTIRDDGKGFRPAQEQGLGLLGMQERVTHLGGTFRVESELGKGTTIFVHLPVTAAQRKNVS